METFVQLKQSQVRNVLRSQVDDILRLREKLEPLNLFSNDVAAFNAITGEEAGSASFPLT